MVDSKATLYDDSYHDTDSNETAFKIATSMAFKEAARNARPVVLEPIMALEVTTSQDYMNLILRDLRQRRTEIHTAEHGLIRANAPLAELLGYAKDLQGLTNNLAECSICFAHYFELSDGELPGNDEARIPATKPEGPNARFGSASARPEDH